LVKAQEREQAMEEVRKQLKQAQEETSASLAVDPRTLSLPDAKPRHTVRTLAMFWKFRKAWLTLLALLTLTYSGWSLFDLNMNKPTASLFVTGVRELATLATAEAYVMTTLEGADNKLFGKTIPLDLPGTKRTYMYVIPAKILAGVDLKQVGEEDVRIDHREKKVFLTLPHATFLEEAVQVDKVRVFTEEGLFRSNTTAKEGLEMIAQATVKEKLRAEAEAAGVLQTAERNAEQALGTLYSKFGYEVVVSFK
jgi:hypothetical protein